MAQDKTSMTTTDTPKRLSDVELAKISVRSQERFSSEYFTARDAHRDRCALLSHIAALTAPPSQGKVERARELLANAYRKFNGISEARARAIAEGLPDALPTTAPIAAITQALTESSGQGTDGACCEAMREAVVTECDRHRRHNLEAGRSDRAAESACLMRAIRALPLPVSADGSAQDRREKALTIVTILANTPVEGWLSRKDIHAALAEFNPKQPSDTGAG